jgi:hypothetical protein
MQFVALIIGFPIAVVVICVIETKNVVEFFLWKKNKPSIIKTIVGFIGSWFAIVATVILSNVNKIAQALGQEYIVLPNTNKPVIIVGPYVGSIKSQVEYLFGLGYLIAFILLIVYVVLVIRADAENSKEKCKNCGKELPVYVQSGFCDEDCMKQWEINRDIASLNGF